MEDKSLYIAGGIPYDISPMMDLLFHNNWVWLIISLVGFALCAFLPVWIKDDRLLRKVSVYFLMPVSLFLIIYAYPIGLEVFRKLALTF